MTKPKTMMYPTIPCVYCGKEGEVEVEVRAVKLWTSGTLIQHAFPNLTHDQREMLLTGTHPECWSMMFPNESKDWD